MRLLSDGIRNILAMVADMAFRCAQINPHLGVEAAEKTSGVVLIDEIEMQLHPEWQHVIINRLMKAFPLVQFVVTTHSPQIVTTIKGESMPILNSGCIAKPSTSPYGHEAGMALPSVFGVPQRPPINEVMTELGKYFELLRSTSYSEEAAEKIKQSLAKIGYELSSAEEKGAALLVKHFNDTRNAGN